MYLIIKNDGGNLKLSKTVSIKPSSLPAGYSYIHWMPGCCGDLPKVWNSKEKKDDGLTNQEITNAGNTDDSYFTDSRL